MVNRGHPKTNATRVDRGGGGPPPATFFDIGGLWRALGLERRDFRIASRLRENAGYGIIFSAGFYALVVQTLLFRAFLTVYEGNELGLGVFFCSWLVWGAIGALLGRQPWRLWERLLRSFEFAPLLFIPAYGLQSLLILHARDLAGVAAYEVFPFARMIPVAWVSNAPVGLVSGLLFTLACSWASRAQTVPVARVFIVEAMGCFAGGVLVTVALAMEWSETGVFLLAVLVAGLASLPACAQAGWKMAGLAPVAVSVLLLGMGAHTRIDHSIDALRWGRVLPVRTLQGRFITPQGTYLYGTYRGQFHVVAWETLADTVPGEEHASEVCAVHLAQHPSARRILVFGPGTYGLCRRLLMLPQVEAVTWLDADPGYPGALLEALPAEWRVTDPRLDVPGMDIRRFLDHSEAQYDLAILQLPDVTTLALNRYMTLEFMALLKQRLAPGGFLSVRVSGGENVMGDELMNMGAAMYRTLSTLFPSIAVKPGDETWLLATSAELPEQAPAVLRDRFASVAGADAVYPVQALPSLYPPDRVSFQQQAYQRAIAADSHERLLNTDRQPRALLHSLLFAAREAGLGQARSGRIRRFADQGAPVVPFAIALYLVLRLVYRHTARRHPGPGATGHFDWVAMVAGTGAAGMAVSIVLMCMYQARYGALFLHVGLISALYMVGLAAGGRAAEWWAAGRAAHLRRAVLGVVAGQLALLATIQGVTGDAAEWVYMVLFLICGVVSGMYFPLAAADLKRDGVPDRVAGGVLAASDSLGGAAGGTVAGLLILPVFGAGYALALLAMVVVMAMLPLLLPGQDEVRVDGADRFGARWRPVAYTLFGIAATCLGTTVWMSRAGEPDWELLLGQAAREMAPDVDFEPSARGEWDFLREGSNYCFSSHRHVEGINGYGGPVTLGVLVDDGGVMREVRVLHSKETPAYLAQVLPWLQTLRGRSLVEPPETPDGVSGATLTSRAILATVDQAGQRFAADVLQVGTAASAPVRRLPDHRVIVFAGLAMAALGLRRAPARRSRRIFLLVVVAGTGLWLNLQYSMAQVLALLRFSLPPVGWNLAFLTVVGIPVLVLLVGNVYCGYLCPFGALQELIGNLRPARIRLDPDVPVWRWARQLKYLLLFVFVMMFAFTMNPELAVVDPLVTVFSRHRGLTGFLLVSCLLGLSFVYPRFWCRNLCPAGAFLSLLNGAQVLRRFMPAVSYRTCGFGLTGKHDLDCLTCDRCRRMTPAERHAVLPPPARTATLRNTLFAAMVLLCGAVTLQRAHVAWQSVAVSTGGEYSASAGAPREVDMRKLRWLIDQGRLSAHEARFADPNQAP